MTENSNIAISWKTAQCRAKQSEIGIQGQQRTFNLEMLKVIFESFGALAKF